MRDFALEVFFSQWEFNCQFNLAGSDAESWSMKELLALALPRGSGGLSSTPTSATPRPTAHRLCGRPSPGPTRAPPPKTFSVSPERKRRSMPRIASCSAPTITPSSSPPTIRRRRRYRSGICELSGIALDIDRDWDLDVDAVRDAVRSNTRLISINFPNNPTGKIIPHESLDALISDLSRAGHLAVQRRGLSTLRARRIPSTTPSRRSL